MRATHTHYERLLARAKTLPAVPTAVAHPCDASSLAGAVDAARLGLIEPILVGPVAKIRAAAQQADIDVSKFELVDAPHSHAAAAAAVALVREGRAQCLMKGSLHTDELMAAVVAREVRRPPSRETTAAISSSVCRLPFMRHSARPSLTSRTASAAEAWL